MSEMSDRVKAAILAAYMTPGEGWEDRVTCAAMEAMREPTEGMIRSALGYENRQLVQGVYRAMVDEALR